MQKYNNIDMNTQTQIKLCRVLQQENKPKIFYMGSQKPQGESLDTWFKMQIPHNFNYERLFIPDEFSNYVIPQEDAFMEWFANISKIVISIL